MRAAAIFGYSPITQGVQSVLELPKGVAMEIKTCNGTLRHRSKDRLEMGRIAERHSPTSHFLRHGKRFIFHWYHALLIGPGAPAIVGASLCRVVSSRVLSCVVAADNFEGE